MSISLSKIAVKDLGPLKKMNRKLGRLNLFYGQNEVGKTFLVEFLIRSLFKNKSRWENSFREIGGGGKVILKGLGGEKVEFNLTSSTKLEDYLLEERPGLPPDIVRLMVVKGAETGINNDDGIHKSTVKNLLSTKEILDIVDSDSRISKTLKDSEITGGIISGPKRGEIKQKEELYEEVKHLNDLIYEIEDRYSGGEHQKLALKKEELEHQKDELVKAKQHKAYLLHQKIQELTNQKNDLPEDLVNSLNKQISAYQSVKKHYKSLMAKMKSAEKKSNNYRWLKQAEVVFRRYIEEREQQPNTGWIVGLSLLIIITLVSILFGKSLIALIAFLVLVIVGAIYWYHFRELLAKSRINNEIEEIKADFKRRKGEALKNKVQLNTALEEEKEDYQTAKQLKRQVQDEEKELQEKESKIKNDFNSMGKEGISPEKWEEELHSLQSELKNIQNNISSSREKLAALDVDSSDYYKPDTKYEYSKKKEQDVKESIEKLNDEITRIEEDLNNLKNRVCENLGQRFTLSSSWEEIITEIYDERVRKVEEYKNLTAEIAGKISVHKVIEELRLKEDEKIEKALSSETIQNPVFALTNRYKKVTMQNDEIIISNDYKNFNISNLSTGAREKALLALRLGFISHLLKEERLFLILDDAFQHCDWPSRKSIVEYLADLANQGWQINYLTMDDHIRRIFNDIGEQFGDDYKEVVLGVDN